jgi:hypothetical protein
MKAAWYKKGQTLHGGGSMKGRTVKWLCSVIFVTVIMLASGVMARAQDQGQAPGQEQAPDQGQVTDQLLAPNQQQAPDQQQAPVKKERSKPKEFRKTFCAEGSAAQRFDMVGAINCNEVCNNAYQEYPCDLQQRLDEGWKITSVAVGSIEILKDPCECKITGTESVLER